MTRAVVATVGLLWFASLSTANDAKLGPPQSPVSLVGTKVAPRVGTLSRDNARLGVEREPDSLFGAVLKDMRPYGDRRRDALIAVYTAVAIPLERNTEVPTQSVNLSLVLDRASGDLLCAYSDPTPVWLQSPLTSDEIAERGASRVLAPAKTDQLQSTVVDVLEALWRYYGIVPGKAGQVVIRPRWVSHPWLKKAGAGAPADVAAFEPSNTWVVEVLGFHALEPWSTVMVTYFRDGDLYPMTSDFMP